MIQWVKISTPKEAAATKRSSDRKNFFKLPFFQHGRQYLDERSQYKALDSSRHELRWGQHWTPKLFPSVGLAARPMENKGRCKHTRCLRTNPFRGRIRLGAHAWQINSKPANNSANFYAASFTAWPFLNAAKLLDNQVGARGTIVNVRVMSPFPDRFFPFTTRGVLSGFQTPPRRLCGAERRMTTVASSDRLSKLCSRPAV